jgi:fructoselysine-6-P-deglycase FrlB-like protein
MTSAESRALIQRELDIQPEILPVVAAALSDSAPALRPVQGRPVWIGGCGDSLFAAKAIAMHARALGWDLRPATAAEMLWDAPIAEGDTVIGVSISGSTRRTVEALRATSARGAVTIAVTLNPDSDLARAADSKLALPYTPVSRAIPPGLDYHVTVLALAALLGEVPGAAIGAHAAEATGPILAQVREIAEQLPTDARFFFLGGGAARGSAAFGAAKLHEAGGLDAWSFEAENFAHGGLFVPRSGDHVVLCGASGPVDARTLALEPDLKRLGLTVSRAGLAEGLTPLVAAFDAALHAQCLCLAVAERLDLDVTDPARGSSAADVQRAMFGWQAG